MVWKGVDAIGCASAGKYHVCEYGSRHCKGLGKYGGSSCWGTKPSHLPNSNSRQCSGGACVAALFNSTALDGSISQAYAGHSSPIMATCGAALLLSMGAVIMVRRWRVRGQIRLEQDVD